MSFLLIGCLGGGLRVKDSGQDVALHSASFCVAVRNCNKRYRDASFGRCCVRQKCQSVYSAAGRMIRGRDEKRADI